MRIIFLLTVLVSICMCQWITPDQYEQYFINRQPPLPNRQEQENNQRISERKCKDFAAQKNENFFIGGLSLLQNVQKIPSTKCDTSQGLIVGGEIAKAAEFPHMAAIGYRKAFGEIEFACGGSLISERYVLTAAHCRVGAEKTVPSVVRVGDLNLKIKEEGLPEENIPIESFISHEQYNPDTRKNDIAVIRLTRNVKLSKYVKPACLMTPNNRQLYTKAIATGWGITDAFFGPSSDTLQKVQLTTWDASSCIRRFGSFGYDYNLDNSQFCAGDLGGGKDTCRGDSGGPIQILSEDNCTHILIGVTSYGAGYCGGSNTPGVYAKVSAYIDWIEKKVWGA